MHARSTVWKSRQKCEREEKRRPGGKIVQCVDLKGHLLPHWWPTKHEGPTGPCGPDQTQNPIKKGTNPFGLEGHPRALTRVKGWGDPQCPLRQDHLFEDGVQVLFGLCFPCWSFKWATEPYSDKLRKSTWNLSKLYSDKEIALRKVSRRLPY